MNHEAIEPAEKKRKKTHRVVRWFAWACAVWIIGDLAALALPAYRAAQGEKTLHAIDGAYSLIAEHHQSKSAWPKSWEDLRQVDIGESLFEHEWPQGEKKMRRRVAIDFAKLPHDAAEAVTPIGPCFDYTRRPGYLHLKSLSEPPSDPEQ